MSSQRYRELTTGQIDLIDEICDSFEQELSVGNSRAITSYLQNVDEELRIPLFCELLAAQLEFQASNDSQPNLDEVVSAYPGFESICREIYLETLRQADTRFNESAHFVAPDDTVDSDPQNGNRGDAPRSFGDYEIVDEIARGGMGVVFRARQVKLNRTVALKVMGAGAAASPDAIRRFQIEAAAAGQLDHPFIVPVYDFGEAGGEPWFSMGLVEGVSLAQRIRENPLSPELAASLIRDIADAVEYAHQNGVVHRDIKPANVMITADDQVRITDFGLARHSEFEGNLTNTGQILGTPNFMAPEQALGDTQAIGPAADVYSMGATLYCILTGRPPFQAATALDTLTQVVEQDPLSPKQVNPSVPVDLATICLKCLSKEPLRRYGSSAALSKDLDRFLKGQPIVARPVSSSERVWKWARRNPLVASLSTLISLALVVLILGGLWYQRQLVQALDQKDVALGEKENALQQKDNALGEKEIALQEKVNANQAMTRLLYKSLTNEATFLNETHPPGYGPRVWRLVDQARQLDTPVVNTRDLRQLAVSSLGHISFAAPHSFVQLGSKITCADVTEDDNYLFVGTASGQVIIFDLARKKEVARFSDHKSSVEIIQIPDNKTVLTFSSTHRPGVKWTINENGDWVGREFSLGTATGFQDSRVTPDGKRVVGFTRPDPANQLWEVFSLRPTSSEQAPADISILKRAPRFRRFDVCNTHFVVGYPFQHEHSNLCLIFDTQDGRLEHEFKVESGSLVDTKISRNGKFVALATSIGTQIRDRETLNLLADIEDVGRLGLSGFVGDNGDLIINGNSNSVYYSLSEQKIIARFPRSTTFSSNGHYRLNKSSDNIQIARLGTSTSQEFGTQRDLILDIVFSPDGQLMATTNDDEDLHLWDPRTGELLAKIPGRRVAFAPNGQLLAVYTQHGNLELWRIPSCKRVATIPTRVTPSWLRFNSQGGLLAGIGWKNETFEVWRINEEAPNKLDIEVALNTTDGLRTFCWSPSGRWLARMSSNGIRVEDFRQPERSFTIPGALPYRSLTFLTDTQLALCAGGISIWDVEKQERVARHQTPNGLIERSPTGRFLLVRNAIMDSQTMKQIYRLPLREATLWSSAWSPDGELIAFGFHGGKIVVWDLPAINDRLQTLGLDTLRLDSKRTSLPSVSEFRQVSLEYKQKNEPSAAWLKKLNDVFNDLESGQPLDSARQLAIDELAANIPIDVKSLFHQTTSRLAERIEQFIQLESLVRKVDRQASEKMLADLILTIQERQNVDLRAKIAVCHLYNKLASYYLFYETRKTEQALECCLKEKLLIAELERNNIEIPLSRRYWFGRCYAYALKHSGNTPEGIEQLLKIYEVYEKSPAVSTKRLAKLDYLSLKEWLSAEDRSSEIETLDALFGKWIELP